MLVRKNKGITLLETIVSMLIISAILVGGLTFHGVMKKSEEEELKEMEATFKIDAVKKLILCNMTYDEIKEGIAEKTIFINKDDLQRENLSRFHISNLIKEEGGEYPLIMLKGNKQMDEEIIKIELLYKFEDGREINHVFYRGNY
jgi:NhaP-type Na+/H+ or K+/H+ antiporter